MLAGDDQLRRTQPDLAAKDTGEVPGDGIGITRPRGPLHRAGLSAEPVEVGTFGHAERGHDGLLSYA
ncbi:hypothetical protein SUDANB95_01888 [Actinosynnema sp. ALI-1.44]